MDNPRNIIHYRTCVRPKDWPDWVRQKGVAVAAVVEAQPNLDGSPREPIVLTPVPDEPPSDETPLPAGMPSFGVVDGKPAYLGQQCETCGQVFKNLGAHRKKHKGEAA